MRVNFRRYLSGVVFISTILFQHGVVLASRVPPHSWIEHYQKQKDFQYNENSVHANVSGLDIFWDWIRRVIAELFYSKGMEPFWRYFPYIGTALILIGLAWYFRRYGVNSALRSSSEFTKSGILPENIHEMNFDDYIREAEDAQNYRWAMRWRYLFFLKTLDDQGAIKWQPHKTNTDYRREISIETLQSKFRHVTRFYEDAWYGEWNANQTDYKSFVDFIRTPLNK